MKRKYPLSYFFLGALQNLIRYFLIGLIGLVLLIIGLAGVHICQVIGAIVLTCYLLLCIIGQFFIRSACLKESNHPDFNQFMDGAFGHNNHDEDVFSPHERIIKMVEGKINSQDNDLDD